MDGGCHLVDPARVTLAAELGEALDGAWWPHEASVGRELPGLTDALAGRLGKIGDIGVNWSNLSGMPNLDSFDWRGHSLISLQQARRQRVVTLTGKRATARLLLIPPRTSTALAVMLMRRAARLPILTVHQDTEAFRVADEIVRATCAEKSPSETAAATSP